MSGSDEHRASKHAVLYTRVSTDDQVLGYSLNQQVEALRAYCAREGYEVLEEVRDEGWSGAYLERPGLDQVRELVEAGGVDVVLAQDADRITRDPIHRALLDDDFEGRGTQLLALDDWGDGTHEGELLKYLKGWVSKGERLKIADRTRRGKRQKAREGKVVAPRKVAYGFKLSDTRDGYVVDEEKMGFVRRVFHEVAGGASLYAVKRALEVDKIATPSGGTEWSRSTLREMVMKDAYFPHTFEEVKELVKPEVAGRLDHQKAHGIWWASRHDIKVVGRKKKTGGGYAETRRHGLKPKEDWVAVPIPDAGIPREVAEQARRNVEYGFRQANMSKGRRVWELAGGLLYCGECGRRMAGHSVAPLGRKPYYYYVCPRKVEGHWSDCSNKSHRAEVLEKAVRTMVGYLLMNPEEVERQIEKRVEKERGRNPGKEAATWAKKLDEIDEHRKLSQKMAARGQLDLDALDELVAELKEERATAERELEAARGRKERIEELENERKIVLAWYSGFAAADLNDFAPEERRYVYRGLGLKATVDKDGRMEVKVACSDYFPSHDDTSALVERVMNDPERKKARRDMLAPLDAKLRRAGLERAIPEERRSVMSCDGSS